MKVSRITSVLFAANIEPCVKFWTERLGFQKTAEVPEGNSLGFAILEKDGVELMYQSYASADKDNASTGPLVRNGPSFLYVEVSDLDAVISAMKGIDPAIPLRTTFYGMRENGREGSGGARCDVRAENGPVVARAYLQKKIQSAEWGDRPEMVCFDAAACGFVEA